MRKRLGALALVAWISVACGAVVPGAQRDQASSSRVSEASSPREEQPSPTASAPSPAAPTSPAAPVSTAVAAVVSLASPDHYNLSVIRADGRVIATVSPARRTVITLPSPNGSVTAVDLPYISTTRTKIYYLDGDWMIRWLDPSDGSTGEAMRTPLGNSMAHIAFAVSPDDSRIAISAIEYGSGSQNADVRLFVGPLRGALTQIFSSTKDFVWPVGWHGDNLVLATRDEPPFAYDTTVQFNPYGAKDFHVVSAQNADRLTVIGNPMDLNGCWPTGLLTVAGTACYVSTAFGGQSGGYAILDWKGNRYFEPRPASWDAAAAVSPEPASTRVLVCCQDNAASGLFLLSGPDGASPTRLDGAEMDWGCWLDPDRVLAASRANASRVEVMDLSAGSVALTGVQGYCAGVVPTDLG